DVAESWRAGRRLVGDPIDGPAVRSEPTLQVIDHEVDAVGEVRAAVDVDEGAEVLEILVEPALGRRADPFDLVRLRDRRLHSAAAPPVLAPSSGAPSAGAASTVAPSEGVFRMRSSASISVSVGAAVAPRPRAAASTVRRFASAISSLVSSSFTRSNRRPARPS